MKKHFTFCLLTTALLGTHAFALEIYKGKLINHKEWTTGNAKVVFKPIKSALSLKSKTSYSYVDTMTGLTSAVGTVNAPTYVSGMHHAYVSNESAVIQSYSYTISICAFTSAHTAECAHYFDEVSLEPGGYAAISEQPILQTIFTKPGTYQTNAATHISGGNNSDGIYISSSSSSDSTIVVTDSQSK